MKYHNECNICNSLLILNESILFVFIGTDFQTAQQLVETIWAYEEWMSEKKIEFASEFVARAEQIRRLRVDPLVQASPSISTQPSASQNACVVCMSEPRVIALIPCGHLSICRQCYSRLHACPICRAVIRGAIYPSISRE